ncbi:MAG: hypothetical protein QW607_11360 [Desulfurococcaceae archaeon]
MLFNDEEEVDEEISEENEETVDIKSVRINYLEKFIQITKTWINVLTGEASIDDLKKIRSSLKERSREKKAEKKRSRSKRSK